MGRRTLAVRAPEPGEERLGFFRFGRVAGKVLLTGDAGEWSMLDEADFERLLEGGIRDDEPLAASLRQRGFLLDGADLDEIARRIGRKRSFLTHGPHLHILIVTLRCNQSCRYCHASRAGANRTGTDMSLETARSVVDLAMRSTSPSLTFEFQGGEPTLNFPVIPFVVELTRERNREEGRSLVHALVSNLTAMDDDKAGWLLDNDVLLCTSLDGPPEVHDWNRPWSGGGAFEQVTHWIRRFNRRYVEMGRDPRLWHVDALMTTTRRSFARWREIVDLYVDLGIRSIRLRPLNPFGFARGTWKTVGYEVQEYLDFYERCLDYILELNLQGVELVEGTAATFLAKILTPEDPGFVDIRSPCGAGTGQVAYHHDGSVYPCDEARMIASMGDDLFRLGEVGSMGCDELLRHPTVRALALASHQDSLPGCESCWNRPFCGVCPMHSYMRFGDIFGQRPRSPKCKEYMGICRMLFERLQADLDGSVEAVFRRWTLQRPREAAPPAPPQ